MRTKDELDRLRERAIALRRDGKSRREIKALLGLAGGSTLNELLQGVPPPDWTRRPNAKDDLRAKARELRADGLSYNEITARLGVSKSSVSLWVRDLPGPIGLFLRFLDAAGISRSDLVFTVCIHESGDVAAACRFWLEVTKASPEQFNKVSLKRHNPRTTRKNIGEGYHGCLLITAHRSSDLYRKIEGWAAAAMIGPVLSTRSA